MSAPHTRPGPPPRPVRLPLPRTLGTTFRSLEHPGFARYFWGSTAFFFGMNMQIMLRGWLVFVLTSDTFALGLINASFAVPTLVLSPIGGVIADRFNRRAVIVVSQTAQLLLTVVLTVLVLTETVAFWHVLVMSVLSAATSAFNMPARQAIVPELVGREGLMNAIALNTGAMNLSRIVAPALAGLLVAPIGIGGGFVVTLGFYALAILFFARVRPSAPQAIPARTGFSEQLVDGVRYLRDDRVLLILLAAGIAPMFFGMPQQILLPAFADVFDTDAAGVGLMQAAAGIGGLAGAVIAANIGRPRRPALTITASLVIFGVFVVAFALSPALAPALVMLALGDVAAMLGMTVNNTVVQELVPDAVRGRVMALMMMSFGLTPLAVLPAGAAARAFGVEATVAVGGLLLILVSLAIYLGSATLRSLDHAHTVLDTPRPRAP